MSVGYNPTFPDVKAVAGWRVGVLSGEADLRGGKPKP